MLCAMCKQDKAPEAFGACRCWCRDCKREYDREYHANSRFARRAIVLEAYGGRCACCGEHRFQFLTIDHVNNDGAQHRKEIGGNLYHWLLAQGCPQDGRFQVLCMNCQVAKAWFGACPHGYEMTGR